MFLWKAQRDSKRRPVDSNSRDKATINDAAEDAEGRRPKANTQMRHAGLQLARLPPRHLRIPGTGKEARSGELYIEAGAEAASASRGHASA